MIMGELKSKSPLALCIKYSDASLAAELYDREGEKDRMAEGLNWLFITVWNSVVLERTSKHRGSPAMLTGLVTGFTTFNITNGVWLNI